MPPILFPASTSPGKDEIEGGGRLINCYSEQLGVGSTAQYIIRRAPGLTLFSSTSAGGSCNGLWYDGNSTIFAHINYILYYIDADGVATQVGAVAASRLSFMYSGVDTSNLTAYTFANISIPVEEPHRRVIVAVLFDSADDYPAASVTVGGVAATFVVGQGSSVALYIALVPTGSTASVVVTYASPANRCAIAVWRLRGATTNTPYSTVSATGTAVSESIDISTGSATVAAAVTAASNALTWGGVTEDSEDTVEAAKILGGASGTAENPDRITVTASGALASSLDMVVASWKSTIGLSVTFAKNNAATPDYVMCITVSGAYTFTKTSITALNVNSEIPNSVCFLEGYFFFTTPEGLCYASGLNATTVNSLDVVRCEAKPEYLYRGIGFDGELWLFSATHIEVFGSGGNPNLSGFPLKRTTVIWRGLIGPRSVCGFEDGFHPALFFVADDASVRMMQGYAPVSISTPDLERAIAAVSEKTAITAFVYDIDGHACVVIDLNAQSTWVYDIKEQFWHERKTGTSDYWRPNGNSVKAFDRWLVGDHLSDDIYQIDKDSFDDGAEMIQPIIAESIAMESFPSRLQIPRADFNFVTGVGDATTRDPAVFISWSDDGGHTWSDPVTRKLGESGRYFEQIRLNRVGQTGRKGRRWRVQVDDPVYFGLLGGSMEVTGRP